MRKHIFQPPRGMLKIALVGCGGTGSQMLTALARMDLALRNLGSDGLIVDCYDPDTVSPANAGRQSFYSCDIGKNKAAVLRDRHVFCFMGFRCNAIPQRYNGEECHVLISCVDSRKSRRGIVKKRRCEYYVDCGNGNNHGQVILGNGKDLPWPEKFIPGLISTEPEDDTPSCSLAEALEKQDLFVNDFAVRIAAGILWDLFRYGGTDIRGAFYTLNPISVNPVKIIPGEDNV